MLGRIAREEAGMTMALSIMIIVLIAVMGAGLLTFAMRDLNAVVEVNQGQKASEAADLGIQAAKRQLLSNSFPNLYNVPATATFTPDPANVEWAVNSPSAACGGLPSGPGKCITSTNNGDTRVTIRYLPPPNGPGSACTSRTDPNCAPVDLPLGQTDYPDQEDYFRIDSEAMYGKARRKIQAIYVTGSLGLPVTYRVSGDININGGTTINNLSIFSGGNITGIQVGSQNTLIGRDLLISAEISKRQW